MMGHNQPSFDNIVEENLLRGIYLVQLQALQRCIKDPRLDQRHRLVLVVLSECTNSKTGMAYPGRAWLAANITYFINGEPRRYSEGTIANTLSELATLTYLAISKRAPASGGRALAHYVITSPTLEEMQAEIAKACAAIKALPKRSFPTAKVNTGVDVKTGGDVRADVNTGVDIRSAKAAQNRSDVTPGVDVKTGVDLSSDVNSGVKADVNSGVGTVTGIDSTGRNNKYQLSQQSEPKAKPVGPERAKRATPRKKLPHGWRPNAAEVEWARERYVASDAQIAGQAERFHDYHISKGTTMADWSAAWRTWWGNGFHKIPRRVEARAPLLDAMPAQQAAYLRELDAMGDATLSAGKF